MLFLNVLTVITILNIYQTGQCVLCIVIFSLILGIYNYLQNFSTANYFRLGFHTLGLKGHL